MQHKNDFFQRTSLGRNQWKQYLPGKDCDFEAVKRKGIERMVPPAIVHGRAYGNKNSILVHCASIVPKDGRKNQALN